uniref:C-type lectin domain-containing protein n=1 Tax=Anabas testudineus TaxID=64144 RepID=A0A3Q1GZ54_ANATE
MVSQRCQWSCVLTRVCFVTDKTCPAGWTKFSCFCYFLSTKTGSWTEGRQDCRTRGADLVVIDNSAEVQTFLSGFTSYSAWIGLTDVENEGIWKWIDDTGLTLKYWAENQPDNHGEEDCAHLRSDNFLNDLSCQTSSQWICEKNFFAVI